jgi:hypothetical protein
MSVNNARKRLFEQVSAKWPHRYMVDNNLAGQVAERLKELGRK